MRIFVDIDGVLGDFREHTISLGGQSPSSLGDEKLWALVDQDKVKFWSEMPVRAGAHELFDTVRPHDPIVLSGCPFDAVDQTRTCRIASHEKKAWIHKHFGIVSVVTCFSRDKFRYMSAPGDILIDDWKPNIDRWENAGGVGILYQNHEQAIRELNEKLAS